MWTVAYFLISSSVYSGNNRYWMDVICMFVHLFLFFCLFILIPNYQEKRKLTVKQEKVVNYYYYCAIVKYMCLFFISWPAICPIRYLGDTVYSSWEYGTSHCMAQHTDLPHTDCTCTVCQRPFERARSEQTTQSGRSSESNSSPMDTKTTSTPIPVGQSVEMITCLCFVNTRALRGGTIALQRCTGRSAIIRRPIVISKRQIFPFRVRIGA